MAYRYLTGLFLCLLTFSARAQSGGSLEFIRNDGQWEQPFLYKAVSSGAEILLEPTSFFYIAKDATNSEKAHDYKHGKLKGEVTMRYHAYRVSLEGAKAVPVKESKIQQHYYNYFLGNDSSRWKANIHPALALDYSGIYPGIDMHIASQMGNMKYEFIVQPGSNPEDIVLHFDGTDGLTVENGKLQIKTSVGTITEMEPYAYQPSDKGRKTIACRYRVKNNRVYYSFPRGYDETLPLIIDPVVIFATFTGSTADNWGMTATYDNQGNFYGGGIVHVITGTSFPTTPGAFQVTWGGGGGGGSLPSDMTITKFNATGTTMVYSTMIGGAMNEQPHSLIVDPAGNLLIAGRTYSGNFPVTGGAFDVTHNGGADIVVVKLNPTGTALIGSTYIGGSGEDGVNVSTVLQHNYGDDARSEIITDRAGNAYVAAASSSTNFPVQFPTQPSNNGQQDAVIFKLNGNLSSLMWSTYMGGSADDAAYVLALDTAQTHLYVSGGTSSINFPSSGGTLWPTFQGGTADGYIARFLNSAGFPLQRTTFIGRSSYDQCYGVQVDLENNVYAMGQTLGGTFPVTPGVFANANSSQFIIKLDSLLGNNIYSTVFGSGNPNICNISPVAFLVDTCQNVYLSGWGGAQASLGSTTVGMPVTLSTAIQTTTDGNDFYYFVLAKNGVSQLYGSWHGHAQGTGGAGEHVDGGTSRFDKDGVIYQALCGACGNSTNTFPTTPGVWAPNKPAGVNCNLAAVKIAFELGSVNAVANANPNTKGCPPFTVNFQNTSTNAATYTWTFGDNTSSTAFTPTHTYNNVGVYNVRMVAHNPNACKEYDTAFLTITVDTNRIKANFDAVVTDSCGPYRAAITNTSVYGLTPGSPGFTTFRWFYGDNTSSTGASPGVHSYPDTGTYTIMLVMRDSTACNNPDTIRKTIRISSFHVKAGINMPDSVCIGGGRTFTNGSVNATYQIWYFGDGQSSTAVNPSYTYNAPGSYEVMLVAGNSRSCNKFDTVRKRIYIMSRPTAAFTHAPVIPVTNMPVDFTNGSLNAATYTWNFGDGTGNTEVNPSHMYKRTGRWTVCLIARSTDGCTDTVCRPVETDIRTLIDLPTAFSPNGDGSNDILFVQIGRAHV